MRKRTTPVKERFWQLTASGNDCIVWRAATSHNGYGLVKVDGKNRRAHRVSWEMAYGSVPRGLWVLHKCDNPPCVRPDHLYLGTAADNSRDMATKGRSAFGPRNHNHKLTEASVRLIRTSPLSTVELAKRLRVSQSTVWHARAGNTWAHVKEPKP